MLTNPFILRGYVSDNLFCDREEETMRLREGVVNGNNIALIAQRRVGKTGLIAHFFNQPDIKSRYYTFLIDIYATKTIEEMVNELGKAILTALKPKGRQVMQAFINCLHSLRSGISFDAMGNPSWNVEIGSIHNPQTTLNEIFEYLKAADKPCIVAIDEFQTVCNYPEKTAEALLRTHIQHCHNATFIFSGSQRTMMSEMFLGHNRPFYQSASVQSIGPIAIEKYIDFAQKLFQEGGKDITETTIKQAYHLFDGVTWYVQRMLNKLYSMTSENGVCDETMIETALDRILDESAFAYQALLFQLPVKQKELFIAICKEGKVHGITSSAFIRRYSLSSASSVQSAVKGLLDKDFITYELDSYEAYDKFFRLWLLRQ